jgi:hypothetical protein
MQFTCNVDVTRLLGSTGILQHKIVFSTTNNLVQKLNIKVNQKLTKKRRVQIL